MEFKLLRPARSRILENSSIFSQSELKVPKSHNRIAPDGGQTILSHIRPSIDIQMSDENEAERLEKQQAEINASRQEVQKMLESDDEDQLPTNFEDGRASKVEYQKCQIIDASITLVAFIGAALTILGYDLEFNGVEIEMLTYMLWMILGTTGFLIVLTILRYLQKVKYLKVRNLLSPKENLFNSGQIYSLNIVGIRIDQYSDVAEISYYYYLNDFFSLLIVVRLYLVLRLILNNTPYRSPRARRVTIMYGADNEYLYACKCLVRESPLTTVLLVFLVSIVISGYMLRICERPLNRQLTLTTDFTNYFNSMWCVVVTMTTVGYGDFYPRTHFGRVVTFMICIWSIFIISLMVVTLNNVLTLTNVEEKSLTVLKRLNLRTKVRQEAAYVLTNMAKIGLNNRKSYDKDKTVRKNKQNIVQIKKHLGGFKNANRQIKSLNSGGSVLEEMHKRFDIIGDIIHELNTKQDNLERSMANLDDKLVQQNRARARKYVPSTTTNTATTVATTSDVSTINTLKVIGSAYLDVPTE